MKNTPQMIKCIQEDIEYIIIKNIIKGTIRSDTVSINHCLPISIFTLMKDIPVNVSFEGGHDYRIETSPGCDVIHIRRIY